MGAAPGAPAARDLGRKASRGRSLVLQLHRRVAVEVTGLVRRQLSRLEVCQLWLSHARAACR